MSVTSDRWAWVDPNAMEDGATSYANFTIRDDGMVEVVVAARFDPRTEAWQGAQERVEQEARLVVDVATYHWVKKFHNERSQ